MLGLEPLRQLLLCARMGAKTRVESSLCRLPCFSKAGLWKDRFPWEKRYLIHLSTLSFLWRVRTPMRLLESLRRRQRNPFHFSQQFSSQIWPHNPVLRITCFYTLGNGEQMKDGFSSTTVDMFWEQSPLRSNHILPILKIPQRQTTRSQRCGSIKLCSKSTF